MRYLIVKNRVVVNIVESADVPVASDADYAVPDGGQCVGDVVEAPYAKADIAALEAGQHRAVREALLTGDLTRLRTIDASIAEIRKKLK